MVMKKRISPKLPMHLQKKFEDASSKNMDRHSSKNSNSSNRIPYINAIFKICLGAFIGAQINGCLPHSLFNDPEIMTVKREIKLDKPFPKYSKKDGKEYIVCETKYRGQKYYIFIDYDVRYDPRANKNDKIEIFIKPSEEIRVLSTWQFEHISEDMSLSQYANDIDKISDSLNR